MPAQPSPERQHGGLTVETVQPLLTHFDSQEAALLAMKSLLADIGNHSDDAEATRTLMTRISAATELMSKLDSDASLILQQIADAAGFPREKISARALIKYFDLYDAPTADAIRASRSRLLRLKSQLERVAAGSGWIISERRRFRHIVLQAATGIADSDRYDKSGKMALSPESIQLGTRS